MKNSLHLFIITVFILTVIGTVFSQQDKKTTEDHSAVRFTDGVFVTFTSKMEPAIDGKQLLSSDTTFGNNAISRVFIDTERGVYFGYDLMVEPVPQSKQYKLTLKPLSVSPDSPGNVMQEGQSPKAFVLKPTKLNPAKTEGAAETKKNSIFPAQVKLSLLALPNLPEPQLLSAGETLALDVLVNRQTGVKVVDLIKVATLVPLKATTALTRDTLAPTLAPSIQKGVSADNATSSDLTIDAIELQVTFSKLLINGQTLFGGDGENRHSVAGSLLWLYLRDKGRFILSLAPHSGYDFKRAGTVDKNRITFSINGDTYEWISSSPIIASASGRWNLWVLYEPDYRPNFNPGQENRYWVSGTNNAKSFLKKQ